MTFVPIEKWKEENEPLGLDLGYPQCCVDEFCAQPPQSFKGNPSKDDHRRYKAGCLKGEFTGFIPCKEHAKQIVQGKITLHSLIKNRSLLFPPFHPDINA